MCWCFSPVIRMGLDGAKNLDRHRFMGALCALSAISWCPFRCVQTKARFMSDFNVFQYLIGNAKES